MYYKRQEAFRYAFSESIPAVCEVFESTGPDERKKFNRLMLLSLISAPVD